MVEPRIRPAARADDDALGALDRATWSPLHAVTPRPSPPYGPFFDSQHRPEDFLVAEYDGAGLPGAGRSDGGAATEYDGAGLPGAGRSDGGAATGDPEDPVAGYIRVARPTPLASNAHVRQIQGLAVHPWARRRGVARALLRAGAVHARNQGARRLTLRVLGHNTVARALYESEGYRVEGILPGEFHLDGAYVDDVMMGLSLE
ncbi:GNAT family N-acetyltransferase [Streptomyces sp. NPDC059092]|uniref:GNAT family N-acetyltransferase n=1 Tax=Streptomyces sp. NPDC059092 TaxID=3346725 RepID=UPI0036ACE792